MNIQAEIQQNLDNKVASGVFLIDEPTVTKAWVFKAINSKWHWTPTDAEAAIAMRTKRELIPLDILGDGLGSEVAGATVLVRPTDLRQFVNWGAGE